MTNPSSDMPIAAELEQAQAKPPRKPTHPKWIGGSLHSALAIFIETRALASENAGQAGELK
jgi:hypothetical protein